MPPSLVLVIATVAYVAAGASLPPTDSATSAPCANHQARCHSTPDLQEFVCRTAGFTEVPPNLPYSITQLDLTSNNITVLNETSLSHYTHMEELTLSENKLEFIHPKSFTKNVHLKRLLLQGCTLTEVPVETLRPLVKLQTL
jgi:Leucine-rich repeat (LRR) protein